MNKREHLFTVAGNINWCRYYKNGMVVPPKIINGITIWFSNLTSGYISKEMKTGSQRDICTPCSVQFNHSVMSSSLQSHGMKHARCSCPSPTPRACSNSCPSSRWYYPTISSSVVPFFSCLQSFPESGSFPMSQFFASGSQSIGVSPSALVLPMIIQHWYPLGWTGLISVEPKGHPCSMQYYSQ